MYNDVQRHVESTRTAHLVSAGLQIVGANPVHAFCLFCGEERDDICARRLNTAYHDEVSNWLTSCYSCYEESVDHYRELWAEVYR